MKVARAFFYLSAYCVDRCCIGLFIAPTRSRIVIEPLSLSGLVLPLPRIPEKFIELLLTQDVSQALRGRIRSYKSLWLVPGVSCHCRDGPVFVGVEGPLQGCFRVLGAVYFHQALIARGSHDRGLISNSTPHVNEITVFLHSRIVEIKDITVRPG